MNYSIKNPAYGRMMDQQYAARVNDEARLANDLQASLPGMTRTEALKEASRLIDKHGQGLTVAGHKAQAGYVSLYRLAEQAMYWRHREVVTARQLNPLTGFSDRLMAAGYCLDRTGD